MVKAATTDHFLKLASNRFKFSLFLLFKLPSAWLSGVRIHKIDADSCTTVVPYKWLSQNPFGSTYFACLAMAAEMSTGVLAMAHVSGAGARVSMLVTGLEGIFLKKAKSRTYFTCEQGDDIRRTILQAVESGNSSGITIDITGKAEDGTEIARFKVTWSFKSTPKT